MVSLLWPTWGHSGRRLQNENHNTRRTDQHGIHIITPTTIWQHKRTVLLDFYISTDRNKMCHLVTKIFRALCVRFRRLPLPLSCLQNHPHGYSIQDAFHADLHHNYRCAVIGTSSKASKFQHPHNKNLLLRRVHHTVCGKRPRHGERSTFVQQSKTKRERRSKRPNACK